MTTHSQATIDHMSVDELVRYGYITVGLNAIEDLQDEVNQKNGEVVELEEALGSESSDLTAACEERDQILAYLETAVRIIKDLDELMVAEEYQEDIDEFLGQVVNDESLPNWRFAV